MIKAKMSAKIYLLLDDLRSAHNVGSILRTAEGLGVHQVYLCGITPYPKLEKNDQRLPYLAEKINKRIAKTALGAELSLKWQYSSSALDTLKTLKAFEVEIVALEQDAKSIALNEFHAQSNILLIVGNEITGVSPELKLICDQIVEIPMAGQKESYNVSAAAAMALFYLTLML